MTVAGFLLIALGVAGVQVLRTSPVASGVAAYEVPTSSERQAATTTTVPDRNPFADPAILSYLSSRQGDVTAAVFDVSTGKTYVYRPHVRQVTASMVKIDLVAALLVQAQNEHRSLSAAEQDAAKAMIEASDNKSAQKMFKEVGDRDGLAKFNATLGMSETLGSWGWGLTATTPADQLELLKHIALPSAILSNESQLFERNLMEHVVDSERFGIPVGVPADATIGVKNGWYNEHDTGWQINSAGYVHSGNTFYLACVMTSGSPTQTYGTETTSNFGRLLYSYLAQA